MGVRMSFRRKPAQSNDVINFRDGYLADPVKTQEPLSALKDEITQLRSKLDDRDESRVRSATMDKISALEKKVGFNSVDGHQGTRPKPHSVTHRDPKHKNPEHRDHDHDRDHDKHSGSSCPNLHSRARVLEKLESLERSMGSTQVSEQLSRLELKLAAPSQHVMEKLNSLESRLSEVSPEHVLKKLSALESKLSQPHEDQQFTHALSRLNALHEDMVRSDSNSLQDVKASVHSKLLELENRITTPQVTTDDWLQERKRLSKLQAMRSKIANA